MALRYALEFIFPRNCVDLYLNEKSFLDVECFKAGFCKALGYGVILGSSLVKVPQVIKLLQAGNAVGISILSVLLELLTYTTNLAYSVASQFPFSSYGEAAFLVLQTFIIAWMAIAWERSRTLGLVFATVFIALLAVTFSPAIPVLILFYLQALNIPIMISSKLLQIHTNWRNGSTGQLSAITVLLFALGSTARILTSIQETGDNLIILTFVLSTICNYILVFQVLYYWKSPIRPSGSDKSSPKKNS
ncbi:unnamed protein product [Calicophoron daubneyi]|uniref:Mannose-P-dolichol utilization defect 1 protein homolog n=1 Tax=Calicophoron daubneyi TaxID=300641 RepID=A0AAV2TF87_CALDB